jgi:hypothetical protein
VKLNGWKNDPSLESAVEQVKVENRNRPKSNQIKVVVEYHIFAFPSFFLFFSLLVAVFPSLELLDSCCVSLLCYDDAIPLKNCIYLFP